jgi:hypothetical protein
MVKTSSFNTLYNATYYHLSTAKYTITNNKQLLNPLTSNLVPQVTQLLNKKYQYSLAPFFTNSFVSRHFYNNPVCKSFVIFNDNDNTPSHFISFFLIKHVHNNIVINTAHLYYYYGNLNLLLEQLPDILNDHSIDQLICLDIMDNNSTLLSKFGFSPGTGKLTYYSFHPSNQRTLVYSQIGIIPI